MSGQEQSIQTVMNNHLDVNSDAATFYRDYWTDSTQLAQRSFDIKDKIIQRFWPGGMKGKRVMEIGVGGEGGLIFRLAGTNEVYGVDVSEAAIRNCTRMGLSVLQGNLDTDRLPFDDGYFDVVIALEVFEHFSNPQKAIEEMRRLTRDGGMLLMSAPTPWCHHWPRLFYPSLFREENFTDFLMANGFRAEKIENWFMPIVHNKHLDVPQKMKVWNWFWRGDKIADSDAASFLALGMHFWDKTNEYGLREAPVEALELFRRSYRIDQNDPARRALTHALLYRFLYGEREEFLDHMQKLVKSVTRKVLTPPLMCEDSLLFVKIVLEADRLGARLVDDANLENIKLLARRTPLLNSFLRDVIHGR